MAFEEFKFKGVWRDYQARILDELEELNENKHLHIVAAPGAGKTILGIEVIKRLGKPALVIAPTITIKNQWVDRLCSMFLVSGEVPEWVSKDIRDPKLFTVTTYQSLYSAFSQMSEDDKDNSDDSFDQTSEEDQKDGEDGGEVQKSEEPRVQGEISKKCLEHVLKLLNSKGVKTIVLDEAHHLRNEWWKALTELKGGIKNPVIVSLTATPPYDVDPKEWERYEELCGPMDVEISIPELVKTGDLCPHQDYVYLSVPTKSEHSKLSKFSDSLEAVFTSLKNNKVLKAGLLSHQVVLSPKENMELILEDPSFYSSLLIFLNSIGERVPNSCLQVLGISRQGIPDITPQWLEAFLNGILYSKRESFSLLEPVLKEVEGELKRVGAIEKKRVILTNSKAISNLLSGSLGKLKSIVDIARIESQKLGSNLRMVVLTDYIRKEALGNFHADGGNISKIGVIPIFEMLRQEGLSNIKLCVLTGSLVIIPSESKEFFEDICRKHGVDISKISSKPLFYDERFLSLSIGGKYAYKMVSCITQLFNRGQVNLVVGTQALLGEGWDAPTLNSLVLASNVGSYMLSNQMRGRAIRKDPASPNKVANIWHLITLDLESMEERFRRIFLNQTSRNQNYTIFDDVPYDLGSDIRAVGRRFKAFEAPSSTYPLKIENGFSRLDLNSTLSELGKHGIRYSTQSQERVSQINGGTLARAGNREETKKRWDSSLLGSNTKMKQRVMANGGPRTFIFANTIKALFFSGLVMGLSVATQAFSGDNGIKGMHALLIFSGVVVLFAIPKWFKVLRLWIRNGTLEGSIHQVAIALLETLVDRGVIKTPIRNLRVTTKDNSFGVVFCRLEGAKTSEEQVFTELLKEALGPANNHRYILVRSSGLGIFSSVDYHPVPSELAGHKNSAEAYAKNWIKYVSPVKLVFTRSLEGRSLLLKARMSSLASGFVKRSDIQSVWE
jgi:superfamily II DNA or RNA helicase